MHRWGVNSDMEAMAGCVWMQREPSPGVGFARSALAAPTLRAGKDEARGYVLGEFSATRFPESLSILTLPGVTWRFEKSLWRLREKGRETPERTLITALEKEPPVYAASLRFMPGGDRGYVHVPTELRCSAGTITTTRIHRYHCASFEDFADESTTEFDGAWLDFTGPVSDRIIIGLRKLWPRIRSTLVVTSMKARWQRDVSRAVEKAGGVGQLIASRLDAELSASHEYADTVPMVQATLRRWP